MNDLTDQLLIAIVVYKMPPDQTPAFLSLTQASSSQNISILIYDNSPESWSSQLIQIFIPHPGVDSNATALTPLSSGAGPGVRYLHSPSNPGVSKAYNEAAKFARQLNKNWLLLADQDTSFPSNILDSLQYSMSNNPEIKLWLTPVLEGSQLLSPFKFRWSRGHRLKQLFPGIYPLSNYYFINTGTCINIDLFVEAGEYDERFRLDFSDMAFRSRVLPLIKYFGVISAQAVTILSSSGMTTVSDKLERFQVYIDGLKLFAKQNSPYTYRFQLLLHSLKLTLMYRNLKFMIKGLKQLT